MKSKKRPRIKIELSPNDKLIEKICWGALVAIWIIAFACYSGLPDTIPIHYNNTGQADGFGHKIHILLYPLIATVLAIGMTFLNRFPHIFNYPIPITDSNALEQYTDMTRLVRYAKLAIILIFGIIVITTLWR